MSQGEVLMRRKLQNAVLQKQRDGVMSSQQPLSKASSPPPFQLSTPKRHAAVDFTLPISPNSAHATSPATSAVVSRHHGGGGGDRRFKSSVGLMDDLLDSPPRHSSPLSRRRNSEHRSSHAHQQDALTSVDEQRASQQTTYEQQNEAIHQLQHEITLLMSELRAKDNELAKKDSHMQLLQDQMDQQEQKHTTALRKAMLDVLDEASVRVRTEGHRGIESIRRRLLDDEPDEPNTFPNGLSTSASHGFHRASSQRDGESEEEMLHRALVQSVRQRYMERLCA